MKLVELKNVSQSALSIPQIRGFRLAPGESTKVHPATAAHPAVRRLLPPQGSSLELVTTGNTAEVEPIAPANTQGNAVAAPAVKPQVVTEVAPIADVPAVETAVTESPVEVQPEQSASTEMAGKTLREVFTAGPGITDSNVDALLEKFDSLESLAASSKDSLVDLGFSSSSAKKILAWARA